MGKKDLSPVFMVAVWLWVVLACSFTPAPAGTPAPSLPPLTEPPTLPTETPVSLVETAPAQPSAETPTDPTLPPIPEFDELLYFSGGGAGFGCAEEQYPSSPNEITVFTDYGKGATLCAKLKGSNPAKPYKLILAQLDGKQVVLESNNLLLDREKSQVYWEGYGYRGTIDTWTDNNTISLSLRVWWPVTLPDGNWSILISQKNGFTATGSFTVTRDSSRAYINVLDPNSASEMLPAGIPHHGVHIQSAGSLEAMGVGYAPNTRVYVLHYRPIEGGGYELVQTQAVITDQTGAFAAEIAGLVDTDPLQMHILYGITDPNTILSSTDAVTCDSLLQSQPGAACDYFSVISPGAVPALPVLPTAINSCPGAPPQRMVVGKRGIVCTKMDDVWLRLRPNRSAAALTDLGPGTVFTIVGGPSCANGWSWWQIETSAGELGWISEGGDAIDPYFICPLP